MKPQIALLSVLLITPLAAPQSKANTNGGNASFIGAGANNSILGPVNFSLIGAGRDNTINSAANNSVIIGGRFNTIAALANRSTIAGGSTNSIGLASAGSTIVGGDSNTVSPINPALGNSLWATIGGGLNNLVGSNGLAATIGGGQFNEASGRYATVPGGFANEASGTNSFAAGSRAIAKDAYSFVWGGSPDVDTMSFGPGTFTVRSPGGARFITSGSSDNVGVELVSFGAGWSSISDSNAKTDVMAVDHRQTLAKLAALPVTSWRYKHDPNRRYIGPMAQDFHAAFGLGHDDKHISTLDTDGVTLSAIKGLAEELKSQDEMLSTRDDQIKALEQSIQSMREQLESRGL